MKTPALKIKVELDNSEIRRFCRIITQQDDLCTEMADILWRWHHGEDVTHAEVCNVLDRYETENA